MKKILPILVVGFLILGGFGAVTVAKTCIKINHEPEAPEIEGEWLINEPGPYEYTFKAVDPDNDDLFYQIDWEGDHVIDERVGPFTSGEKVKVSHSWDYKGTATILARAEDIHGAVSEWGELPIEVLESSQQSFTIVGTAMGVGDTSFFEGVTELDVAVTWETLLIEGKWFVEFRCYSSEGMADIDRVEMYINDEIVDTVEGPGPYGFVIEWSREMRSCIFKFVFYGLDGETAEVIIKGSDIFTSQSSEQSLTGSISQSALPSTEDFLLFDDTTPPVIEVTYEMYKVFWWGGWYINFICVTYDNESGIDRLEWYIDGLPYAVYKDPPYEYIITIPWYEGIEDSYFWFFAINGAGLSSYVEIDGSDIKPTSYSQQSTAPTSAPLISNSNDFDITWITLEEAWEFLSDPTNGNQYPIDIRIDEDWNNGFIDTPYPEHAVHYSTAKLGTPDGLAEFIETYEDKEILLYSNSNEGYTWLMYQSILMDAGYSGTIYAWEGGYDAWMDAEYPVRTNTEPEAPDLFGPGHWSTGADAYFHLMSKDPDEDNIMYIIDWGDGTTDETYYCRSGEYLQVSHTYYESGRITVSAYAKDIYGAAGEVSTEEIIIPRITQQSLTSESSEFIQESGSISR